MPNYFSPSDSPRTRLSSPPPTDVLDAVSAPVNSTGTSGQLPTPPPPPPPYYAPPDGLPPAPGHRFPAPPGYGTMPGTMGPDWIHLREVPRTVLCPHCGELVVTMTDYQNGSAAFFSAILLFLFGCHSGGCLIPLCCPMCQDVVHTCPACQSPIATYSRLSQQAVYES